MRKRVAGLVLTISLFLSISGIASADLIDNGGGLVYDTSTNLTWYEGTGAYNWDQAYGWATSLNAGGVTGWRLPWYPNPGNYTFDPTDASVGELAVLRTSSLGNTLGEPYTNAGPFDATTWYAGGFWTSAEYYGHLTTLATEYDMGHGTVGNSGIGAGAFAFAVHDGDIGAPVPEPATLSLLALGLGGLFFRRNRS